MTTDFRALCIELVGIITAHANPDDCAVGYVAGVLIRARAALVDEPAVPDGREPVSVTGQYMPTDAELLCTAAEEIDGYGNGINPGDYEPSTEMAVEAYGSELCAYARAVLTRWGNPAPQPPAEGEVAELVDEARYLVRELRDQADDLSPGLELFGLIHQAAVNLARAADLLQRQYPQPVPVSEGLPMPKDCDAEGRCWWWYPEVPGKTYGYWAHEDDAVPERAFNEQPLHWLPAHALPVPQQQENTND